ncbi:MAG: DUF2520 domain-containing protein [Deltaproteobacteria bacterium]|nr:DUF2520 domain-containing protein [Deltaproteobacteria bacterium]MBW2074905.1 DUF2520 domain-containing protein [Deltaproteobacteria bacterium]RLB81295.1 MAG: DUF2520 domain-containing protein [Deltaproteobacteria bacterium]
MKPTVAIVGCGTVGTATGKLLSRAGYRMTGVATRSLETARRAAKTIGANRFSDCPWDVSRGSDVVFITTPDDTIQSTCKTIAEHQGFEKNAVVIHCSGALSSDILSSARDCGAVVATLHPLQSFASIDEAVSLVPGSYCTIEGDQGALPVVRQMVKDLGGILLEITAEKKTLYHAAAVAASNYLVTLTHLALELNKAAGLSNDISFKALLPLIRGTLSNIGVNGIPDALTGPIARGDVATVTAHLQAMEKDAPGLLPLYRCLGLYTVDLAKAKGTISTKVADQLVALLEPQGGM